jgi:hypothetical protein
MLGVSAVTLSRWVSKNEIPEYGLQLIETSTFLECRIYSLARHTVRDANFWEARARQQDYEANNPSLDEFKQSLFRDINEGKYNGNV